MIIAGKHGYDVQCQCQRCIKERARRDAQQAAASIKRPRRRRHKWSKDLYERYSQLDDIGAFDGPWLNDVDW